MSPSLIRCVSGRFDVGASVASAPRSTAQFGGARVASVGHEQVVAAFLAASDRLLPRRSRRVSSSPKIQAFDCVTETQCVSGRPRRFVLISDATAPSLAIATSDGEKLDAVLHHQADDVAVTDTARFQRMGVTVGQRIEFAPRDLPAFEQQHRSGRRIRAAVSSTFSPTESSVSSRPRREIARDCAATPTNSFSVEKYSRTPMQNSPFRKWHRDLSDRMLQRQAYLPAFGRFAMLQRL